MAPKQEGKWGGSQVTTLAQSHPELARGHSKSLSLWCLHFHINCSASSKGKGFIAGIAYAVVLRQHQQQAEFHRPHEQTGFGSGNGIIRFFHLSLLPSLFPATQTSRKKTEKQVIDGNIPGQGASNPGAHGLLIPPLGPLEPFFPLSPCKQWFSPRKKKHQNFRIIHVLRLETEKKRGK